MKALLAIAAIGLVAASQPETPDVEKDAVVIKQLYVEGASGQIHVRTAGRPASAAPVILFHETPVSSIEYDALIAALATDRVVFAIDTPGYGMSTRPPRPLDIAGYIEEIAPALKRLGLGGPDMGRAVAFGFHTGSVLAVELALRQPKIIQALVLAGFPYRTPSERKERLDTLPRNATAKEHREKLMSWYKVAVTDGPVDIDLDRRLALFGEMALPGRQHWYAYEAVWRYDYEGSLPKISQPTLFLAPHEMLLEQTRAASRLVPGAKLIELPQATDWVLERNATDIAAAIRQFADAGELLR